MEESVCLGAETYTYLEGQDHIQIADAAVAVHAGESCVHLAPHKWGEQAERSAADGGSLRWVARKVCTRVSGSSALPAQAGSTVRRILGSL